MKVISILQPWASLVVLGHKKIETRSWNTKYRGELLIHASASVKSWQGLWHQEPFKSVLNDYDVPPFGAIIGKVNLIHTIKTEYCIAGSEFGNHEDADPKIWEMTDQELAFGDYSPNRYAWLFSNSVSLDKPIPAKGQLGIWNWEGEK